MSGDTSVRAGSREPNPQAVSAVPASIPDAGALVQVMFDYSNIPSDHFADRHPAFCAFRKERQGRFGGSNYEASFEAFIAIAEALYSRGQTGASGEAAENTPISPPRRRERGRPCRYAQPPSHKGN